MIFGACLLVGGFRYLCSDEIFPPHPIGPARRLTPVNKATTEAAMEQGRGRIEVVAWNKCFPGSQ